MNQLREQLMNCVEIENRVRRQAGIAAVITKALEPLEIKPIVVGGSAVEFYTQGQYSTVDVDFVAVITEEVKKTMNDLGFIKKDKYWRIPDTDIMVEFPSDLLVGDLDRIEPVEYNGQIIYYIGIEDLILNRVSEAEHLNDFSSHEWARSLMAAYYDMIDWSYCHRVAIQLQCAKKFEKIQREAKKVLKEIEESPE